MRSLCSEIFDALPRDREIDLVSEIAAPIPALTIARLLGVPRDRWRHFQRCANAMVEMAAGDPADTQAMERHIGLITELGLYLLDRHRDQRQLLIDDPSLLEGAVEEFLRFSTPVQSHARTAMEDCEIAGQKIRAGDYVVMLYASANRDEDVFSEPDRFDVTRPIRENRHLSLGFGEHFCIGAHLARLETRVVFEELLARFPSYEITGPPERPRSTHINGIQSLPVRLGPT